MEKNIFKKKQKMQVQKYNNKNCHASFPSQSKNCEDGVVVYLENSSKIKLLLQFQCLFSLKTN
jgi:hypothetical protein